jgi:hypothetical protein
MNRILEVKPEDIHELDENQLTELLLLLLRTEAREYEIPKSSISGSLEIKATDGGEDARIKWNGGIEKTDWIPNRYTLFQCKAKKYMPPSECEKEILSKKGNKLKPSVKEVLDANGSYILFLTQICTQQNIDDKEEAIRKGIQKAGAPCYETADIKIYDANKISIWVNDYLTPTFKVFTWRGRHFPDYFITWDEWEKYPDYKVNYVPDKILSSHISELRKLFTGTRKVARIVGLSGLGKTRLALEVFRPSGNPQKDIQSHVISDQVIYIEASDGLPGIVKHWRDQKLEGILVVDNCEMDLHRKLYREIDHPDSKLSLLTLDYNPESNSDENIISLQPASNEVIEGIIKQSYPSLRDIDTRRIVEFADGFPKIAVMLAQARLKDAPDMGNIKDKDLLEKLLWGRRPQNEEARNVISACALFTQLGFSDDVIHQSNFVAQNICKLPEEKFYSYASGFIEHGILDRRNRYIKVVPVPLAVRLATDWWKRCHPDFAKTLLTENMPNGMAEAMCEQISKLNYVSEARELTKKLCGETAPFGQAEVLNSEKGSRLFRSLVEVNQIDTAFALERAFGSLDKQQLYQVKAGRRNLVWALEKLCFWEEIFPIAARILFLFAVSENETWGNNSTNQFYQLYHWALSGTQAPPELRLRVLDEFLNYNDFDYKKIAIEALGHALLTDHFFRNIGVEIQGSRAPQKEWAPKDLQDVYDYWTECFNRLIPFAIVDDELGTLARRQITNNMRGLVQAGRMSDIELALKSVSKEGNIFWLEAFNQINTIIHFDSSELPSKCNEKLKEWSKLLEPKTFVQRWKSTVSYPYFGLTYEKDEEYEDKSNRLTSLFAEECSQDPQQLFDNLKIAFVGEQRNGYAFGYALGQNLTQDKEFIYKSLETLKILSSESVDTSVLHGFVRAIHPKNAELVEELLDTLYKDDKLYIHTLKLTCSIELKKEDLDRIIELIKAKKITQNDLRVFAFGDVLRHLSPEYVTAFVEDILNSGTEGILPALEILHMHTFQDEEKFSLFSAELQKIVQTPGILYLVGSSSNLIDKHNFAEVVCNLLTIDEKNNQLAANFSKEFISTCCHEKFVYTISLELNKILQILLTRYIDIVWPIFSEVILSEEPDNYYMKLYLKPENNAKFYSDGIFKEISLDILIDWCNSNPEKAPVIVAELTPLFVKQDDGYSFSPIAKYLLYAFGDKRDVQSALDSNMWSFSSYGSRIPYYEVQIEAFKKLEVGKNPGLDLWALKMIRVLEERIKNEKGREKEQELGIFDFHYT